MFQILLKDRSIQALKQKLPQLLDQIASDYPQWTIGELRSDREATFMSATFEEILSKRGIRQSFALETPKGIIYIICATYCVCMYVCMYLQHRS